MPEITLMCPRRMLAHGRVLVGILLGSGDPVILVEPLAQIDQTAALAAERAPRRLRTPNDRFSAARTGDDRGHG
ncbi:conserved hypothetical protein [Thiocapsa sp. KS1]|nr:conserved hypothetical protein [Thiocapsa sp. KS1]